MKDVRVGTNSDNNGVNYMCLTHIPTNLSISRYEAQGMSPHRTKEYLMKELERIINEQ